MMNLDEVVVNREATSWNCTPRRKMPELEEKLATRMS
jgi:hypothetical protein